jgi:hypothetical protein
MSTNGITTVSNTQDTRISGSNKSSVLDTSRTDGANTAINAARGTNPSGSANSAASNSAQDTADKNMARKYMAQAIQTTVNEQPVQQSGFCGLQNNAAEIAKAKGTAATQLADIADQFMNSGISGSEALQIASQFVSQVKAAGGKAISSEQMLSLQQLVSKAARTDDTITGSSSGNGTSVTDSTSACTTSTCGDSTSTSITTAPDCGFSTAGSRKSADETQDSAYPNSNRKSYTGDVTRQTEQTA